MFFVFFSLTLSKDIYVSVANSTSDDCFSSTGCSIESASKIVENFDKIHVVDEILEGDNSKKFLDFINKTTSKNISVFGAQTSVISPNYQISESAAIYAENSSILLSDFVFLKFKIPVVNGANSEYKINNCVFKESDMTASALIAFIGSTIVCDNITINNNVANTQSFFIGINCTVFLNGLHFVANFLESQDVRAAIHFVNSTVTCRDSEILANSMKFPIFASSISSELNIRDTLFRSNNVACVIAVEANSLTDVFNVTLLKNSGSFIASGNNSRINASYSKVEEHNYPEDSIIVLLDTNCSISNIDVSKSNIGGIVASNFGENITETKCENISVTESTFTNTIISQNSGVLMTKNISIFNISSSAEIVVVSHQSGIKTLMEKITMRMVTSSIELSTALASVNTTKIILDEANFRTNAICGALFENGSITVNNSMFYENQCFPQGNSLPLAIITTSASDDVQITNTHFVNNTALTGSVFFMNTTGSVRNSKFESNQAVQGAGIVAAGMNITVYDTIFSDNQAMNMGGAVSLTEGNAFFENCDFNGNSANEGGVFAIRNANNVTIKDCNAKRNAAENATFINEDDGVSLFLHGTKVDDDFETAVFLSEPSKHNLTDSFFSCKLRCKAPKVLEKKEKKKVVKKVKEEKEEEDDNFEEENEIEEESQQVQSIDNKAIWLLPVIIFVTVVILFKKFGSRGLMFTLRRLFKGKSTHTL